MSDRRVAILKKVSLSGFADGWGDDCFVIVQPASYKQFKEYTQTKVEEMDEAQGIDLITTLVKEQFVSGRIMIIGDDNKPVIADMEKGDLDSLGIDMLNELFTKIMGVNYDPKAIGTEVTSSKPSLKPENDTETSSSEIKSPSNETDSPNPNTNPS